MADDNEIELVRDWEIDTNLSGLVAPTGKAGNILPEGYFKGVLKDMYINPDRNPNRVVIRVEVVESPFAGATRTSGLNKPTSAEDNVRYYWRALAESCGYSPEDLDAGAIKLNIDSFLGRNCCFYFCPKDPEAGKENEELSFLAPSEWTRQESTFVARQAAMSKTKVNAPAASKQLGGAVGEGNADEAPKVITKTKSALGGGTPRSKVLEKLGIS